MCSYCPLLPLPVYGSHALIFCFRFYTLHLQRQHGAWLEDPVSPGMSLMSPNVDIPCFGGPTQPPESGAVEHGSCAETPSTILALAWACLTCARKTAHDDLTLLP